MWFNLEPKLGDIQEQFVKFCERVELAVKEAKNDPRNEVLRCLRSEILSNKNGLHHKEDISLKLASSLILDLVARDWQLRVEAAGVQVCPPLGQEEAPSTVKERIRRGHLVERDSQLKEEAVADFVKRMERRRLTDKGWHSIFSLMRDGRELAEKLHKATEVEGEEQRAALLAETISPYLQFVEGEATCEITGLQLRDIWRYFRHTWVNVYKSLPGRSMMVLIRDSAAPNHPVIGIGALASSVVQQSIRDTWIGWDSAGFIEKSTKNPTAKLAKWLLTTLDNLIGGVYREDLRREGLCKNSDIKLPKAVFIANLRKEAKRSREQHQRLPRASFHKSQQSKSNNKPNWKEAALTSLFRSKRCERLARLMFIRSVFQDHGLISGRREELEGALKSAKFRLAIGQLIRFVKAEHVGINMMDISVCGAVAPYSLVLGGKLVCLMLCSPEVTQYYSKRYSGQVSIIASSMKGSSVQRPPRLALLCTTSLYGVGSSQYNRLKVPAEVIGGLPGEQLEYKELGLSEGYGSFHFSSETIELIKTFLARSQNGRRVNSIFGEGVNPLMRKIREALELMGLPSDPLLRHGNRRVIYGIPLARNFREVLLGIDKRPVYLINQSEARCKTDMLVEYWRRRWLAPRISRSSVLEEVAKHTVSYPIKHGARVPGAANMNETDTNLYELFSKPES